MRVIVEERHNRGFVGSLGLVELRLLLLLWHLLLWHLLLLYVWHLLLPIELLPSLLLGKWIVARLGLILHRLHNRLLTKYLLSCLCCGLASIREERVRSSFRGAQRCRALIHGRALIYCRGLIYGWVLERALCLLWDLAKTGRCYPSRRSGEWIVSCGRLVGVDLGERII